MSLELDITGILESLHLFEGYARAKELYVDTKKMALRQLNALAALDPTEQKKYIEWMARMFISGKKNMRLYDILKTYDTMVNKNQIEQRDINRFRSPEEVTDAVHAAEMKMGEESRQKREGEIRKLLTQLGGSTQRVWNYLNREVDKKSIEEIRLRMLEEDKGIFGKGFTIDEEIFKCVSPKDIVHENEFVMVVEPRSKSKAKLYGRNHWYNPRDPKNKGKTAPWCVAYKGEENVWDDYAFYQANKTQSTKTDRFYIILPKSVNVVPKKEWAKVIVQVKVPREGEDNLEVWDMNDEVMSEKNVAKLFTAWNIPWREEETQEEA